MNELEPYMNGTEFSLLDYKNRTSWEVCERGSVLVFG